MSDLETCNTTENNESETRKKAADEVSKKMIMVRLRQLSDKGEKLTPVIIGEVQEALISIVMNRNEAAENHTLYWERYTKLRNTHKAEIKATKLGVLDELLAGAKEQSMISVLMHVNFMKLVIKIKKSITEGKDNDDS